MTLVEKMRALDGDERAFLYLPALLALCDHQHAALCESERGGDWADYAGHACCPWCGADATAESEPVTHSPQCKVGQALSAYNAEVE